MADSPVATMPVHTGFAAGVPDHLILWIEADMIKGACLAAYPSSGKACPFPALRAAAIRWPRIRSAVPPPGALKPCVPDSALARRAAPVRTPRPPVRCSD
ncbi:hypothetical protein CVV70_23100 [Ralstonia solanacearum]|nr:hypothetical protein CVS51_19665 [Ralstonia solanacearum]PNQ35390.1 hypothetical protein CVV71_15840 [Ralstonia solanacearum]PNQ40168.1 hypothetical protein CVT21_15135 [Ralstonia solanacearum]PNQ41616.1 hypothetical protein CVT22_16605 [Ralstonia solanacearum]PNQ43169.1 hypothetical protein CVV70_23100 [Ralstonia solanacearum]